MICTKFDEYFEWLGLIKREAPWVVELSNGEVVYQDDYRGEYLLFKGEYGHDNRRSWDILKDYISANNLYIHKMYLKNYNNIVEPLPLDADGYFFKKGALGKLFSSTTRQYAIIGYYDKATKKTKTFKYALPDLLLVEFDERIVDINTPSLILRKEYNSV
jgi:hypothetical protein